MKLDPPSTARPRRGFLVTQIQRMLYFLIGLYAAMIGLLMWYENSFLYPAPGPNDGPWQKRTSLGAEDVQFEAADGVKLHGWYVPKPGAKRVVLYLHGNGDNVPTTAEEIRWLKNACDASVFVFDYRGYGRSEGKPNEKGLYLDGEAAVKWLAERAGVEPSELILVGRSLGTGVAVDVGVKHQVKALVLVSPFAEMPDPAANRIWYAPVRLLMSNRYPSYKKIPNFKGATFIAHGDRDDLVPLWSGKRLFDAAPEPKQWVPIAGAGHNDITLAECDGELERFLKSLDAK